MAGRFRELVVKPYLPEYDEKGKKKPGRSSKWEKVRAEKIEEVPYCENCGKGFKTLRKYRLQVHHVKPYHLWPELELVKDNLMCLCGNPRCHLDKGHLGNFKAWNPHVRNLCAIMLKYYKYRPFSKDVTDHFKDGK